MPLAALIYILAFIHCWSYPKSFSLAPFMFVMLHIRFLTCSMKTVKIAHKQLQSHVYPILNIWQMGIAMDKRNSMLEEHQKDRCYGRKETGDTRQQPPISNLPLYNITTKV